MFNQILVRVNRPVVSALLVGTIDIVKIIVAAKEKFAKILGTREV
jgi:hypothetical protein